MATLCLEAHPDGSVHVPAGGTCEFMAVTPSALYSIEEFDSEAFSYGVMGTLLMFAVGAGIGLLINVLRRARV
ncbi:hypothetical protein [Aromatoleum evansii]|uniref:hypothetical protein n=1 Tax=Aromatoleum evansii TaxID=59406 RepID=UPI00145F81E2|nr:hypothetical protein [Aromatoleum evansii]NMG32341.1 hypothetical protein [Aromatoleum evansii]